VCVCVRVIMCDVEASTMRHFKPDLGYGTTDNIKNRNNSDLRCNMDAYIDCTDCNVQCWLIII